MNKLLLLLLLLAAAAPMLRADSDSDWEQIRQLDKGPGQKPTSATEVSQIAKLHLVRQLNAVRAFTRNYPEDDRNFDAQLREADILAALGKMQSDQKMIDDATKLYTQLETLPGLTHDQRADVSFHRLSLYMQNVDRTSMHGRDLILIAIENFKSRYPSDRRTPRLLVEIASICDDLPVKKRELLIAAKDLSKDEELNLRITDDLKRLDLLDKPLTLSLNTIQGGTISIAALKGKVVALLFWSAESPHCQMWIRGFRQAMTQYPPNSVAVVTVSLDRNKEILEKTMAQVGIQWPTYFDGRGWETPIARQYGINALPTLWILDKKGKLQALNARDNYEAWLHKLVQEN